MHRSLCSWVVTLSLNPNGGTVWPRKTSVGYEPYMRSSSSFYEEVDGCGPPTDLCQPPRPTTPPIRDDYVEVSRDK
jgi:hypothetical protein